MNQKCVSKIQNVKDTMAEITDGLDQLIVGIENEDEEEVEKALKEMLPTPKAISKCFEQLGVILQTAPWENKKAKKHG